MPDVAKLLASRREGDWRKAVSAAYSQGDPHSLLSPFLRPQAITDATSLRRAIVVVEAVRAALEGPYAGTMLLPPLLGKLPVARRDKAAWAELGPVIVETLIAFFARKGYELLAACVIDFDVHESVLTALFSRVADKKAASEAVRKWSNMSHATAASKARARIVHAALGVTPRPVSTLRFTRGPAKRNARRTAASRERSGLASLLE